MIFNPDADMKKYGDYVAGLLPADVSGQLRAEREARDLAELADWIKTRPSVDEYITVQIHIDLLPAVCDALRHSADQPERQDGDESKNVPELFREAVKLTARQKWYLAETIANCIGQTLVDDPDADAAPPSGNAGEPRIITEDDGSGEPIFAAPPQPAPDALREAMDILNNLVKFADDNAKVVDGDQDTWAAHARHLRAAIARLTAPQPGAAAVEDERCTPQEGK